MRSRAGKIFFLGCYTAFSAVILFCAQPPLLRDYPDWVYQGVLLARWLAGHPVAGYALKHYPIPNSFTTIGLALLTLSFGWISAARIWLVLTLAFSAWTGLYVARALEVRENSLWWLLPGALLFGQTFWFATVSFSTGLNLLLLLACLLYRRRERPFPIVALLLVCFFMHLIVYAAAVLMIFLYGIEHRRWRLPALALATTPLAIWYFVARALAHTNETALGYSPLSHLIPSIAVASLLLLAALLRPQLSIIRLLAPVLPVLYTALILGAFVSATLPTQHLSDKVNSALNILQLKAIDPFQLFGFVNISYAAIGDQTRSSSLTILHRPVFLALMLLNFLVGIVLLFAIARVVHVRRHRTDGLASKQESVSNGNNLHFLWDFAAIFALLYFIAPPNSLGVIGIDMRLAQLAFGPALFLLARNRSPALRLIAAPVVLLTLASLFQFAVSQNKLRIPDSSTGLPPKLAHFCGVDPIILAEEYDRLRSDHLEGHIFATGLFTQTSP